MRPKTDKEIAIRKEKNKEITKSALKVQHLPYRGSRKTNRGNGLEEHQRSNPGQLLRLNITDLHIKGPTKPCAWAGSTEAMLG